MTDKVSVSVDLSANTAVNVNQSDMKTTSNVQVGIGLDVNNFMLTQTLISTFCRKSQLSRRRQTLMKKHLTSW